MGELKLITVNNPFISIGMSKIEKYAKTQRGAWKFEKMAIFRKRNRFLVTLAKLEKLSISHFY